MIFTKTGLLQLGLNSGGTPQASDAQTILTPQVNRNIVLPEQIHGVASGGFPFPLTDTSFAFTVFVDQGASVGASSPDIVLISPGLWLFQYSVSLISNVPTLTSIGNPLLSLRILDPTASALIVIGLYHAINVPAVQSGERLFHLRRSPNQTASWLWDIEIASTGVGQFIEARVNLVGHRLG